MAKADRQTIQKRVQEIYQMMCSGASSADIVEYGAQNWQMKRSNVYKLMKRALNHIRQKNEKDIEELKFEACSRFDKLFAKLYKQEKYGEAAKVQQYKNKINGLETFNINHSGKINLVIDKDDSCLG